MAIELFKIDFAYNRENIIDKFSLVIKDKSITAILGDSGSGKSTILRLIAGLETPQKGKITVNNKVLFSQDVNIPPEKRGIGMVFQDYALFPHLNVERNILFGLKKLDKVSKQARLHEVLSIVNLNGYEKRYPHELSGGQQQRVALARSLAPKPTVLLLDEPFSNLDESLKISLRNDVKKIIKIAKITAIFVTHDKQDAISIADEVILIKNGKKRYQGNPVDIL